MTTEKKLVNHKETLPPLSSLAKSLKRGIYEHYSGKQYRVLNVARHSESLEELVIYQALYGENDIWVRPLEMFLEVVVVQSQEKPRFCCISD